MLADFAITKPTVGGSSGTWGTELNAALDVLVAHPGIKVVADAAAKTAYVPLLGQVVLQADTGKIYKCTNATGPVWAEVGVNDGVLTTQGDILIQGASSPARLGIGTAGQILAVNAGATAPEWKTVGTSPLTTKGDVYVYGSADARLPVGTNGQVLTADSSQALGVKWAAASGGTAYEYPIDEPPGSANAMDDEFGGSSVDAKWTILNQTTGQTYTVADGLLKIYNPYTITERRIFALTQPCPAGAWKVRAKFEWDVPARKYYGLGLIIRRTTGNDRSKVFIAVEDGLGNRISWLNVSNLTSLGTEYLGYYLNNTRYYLEAEYDETNIILRISYNGRAFLTILSEAASSFLGGAPEQVGINLQPYPEATSSDAFSFNGSCHWFRRIS